MDIKYAAQNLDSSMSITERDSILNNIETIASTPYATAPYIRSMGIKNYPPESGSEVIRNQYAAEVITQCGLWENRAEVSEVHFEENSVKVVIKGG